VIKRDMELKGTYAISEKIITFKFSPIPEGEAATCANLNLGYDPNTKEGKMTVKVEKDKLILSVSSEKRTFVFEKKDVPSKQSEDGNAKPTPKP
jgi:hypothetical protein